MNFKETISLLEENKNERGIKHWEKTGIDSLDSYGLGLTQIKKLAKQIGRDHNLAAELWKTSNYDCKTLACLIEEPAKVSREQVELQVGELDFWLLSHTYAQNLLPRLAFSMELFEDWVKDTDPVKRRCAYILLYAFAKDKKKLPDEYFLPHIHYIRENLQEEENFVKDAMNNALWMMGRRNETLRSAALESAIKIGTIEVDYGDNSCKPLDVVTHLRKS